MKRFTNITLAVAAVMAIIGVVCMTASFAMGIKTDTLIAMIENGKFSFQLKNGKVVRMENSKDVVEIDPVYENLDIEFAAGSLKIEYADIDKVQIEQTNVPGFEAYVEDNTICIEGDSINESSSEVSIVVTLPNEMRFREVDLELGASEAKIEGLTADSTYIEVGAGRANIAYMDTKKLDMETGVGQIDIVLTGKESDYSYDIECGIGKVKVGNRSIGSFATSQNITNPGAERFLDIECGIGTIQIDFNKGGF